MRIELNLGRNRNRRHRVQIVPPCTRTQSWFLVWFCLACRPSKQACHLYNICFSSRRSGRFFASCHGVITPFQATARSSYNEMDPVREANIVQRTQADTCNLRAKLDHISALLNENLPGSFDAVSQFNSCVGA